MMTLPHLSSDPDAVFDALDAEVPTWPQQTARLHYERLFAWLATHFGGTVVIERSAMSLSSVPWLQVRGRQWPRAPALIGRYTSRGHAPGVRRDALTRPLPSLLATDFPPPR